jgi:hypothetical protein
VWHRVWFCSGAGRRVRFAAGRQSRIDGQQSPSCRSHSIGAPFTIDVPHGVAWQYSRINSVIRMAAYAEWHFQYLEPQLYAEIWSIEYSTISDMSAPPLMRSAVCVVAVYKQARVACRETFLCWSGENFPLEAALLRSFRKARSPVPALKTAIVLPGTDRPRYLLRHLRAASMRPARSCGGG